MTAYCQFEGCPIQRFDHDLGVRQAVTINITDNAKDALAGGVEEIQQGPEILLPQVGQVPGVGILAAADVGCYHRSRQLGLSKVKQGAVPRRWYHTCWAIICR